MMNVQANCNFLFDSFCSFRHETPKSMLPYYEVCKTVWIQIAVEMSYQFWHKEIFFAKKYFDIFYQLNANLYPLSRICVQLFSLFYLEYPLLWKNHLIQLCLFVTWIWQPTWNGWIYQCFLFSIQAGILIWMVLLFQKLEQR